LIKVENKESKTSTIIMLISLQVGINQHIFAQARAGIKGGLNVSNLYIDDVQ
jgi:hypothetical protein